jgi:ADP-heptose:LPS heptosyltransferase
VTDDRRIGVLRIGSIGDHVIALPIYRHLRALHASDSLTLITNVPASGNPKVVGPASILPPNLFDDSQSYPLLSGWRNAIAVMRLFRRLRLDRLYYLMPRRTSAQFRRDSIALRLLVRELVGLNAAATEAIRPVGSTGLYEHEADRLARAIGLAAADRALHSLSLDLTAEERSSARKLAGLARGAVVISVGTKCDVNHWGRDNWRQLIARLGRLTSIEQLFLVGSADEYAECDELRASWPRDSANFCGRLSPRQSAALMAESKLFVGHDSGPMHLASAVGVPVVAIFSSRNLPGTWYPLNPRSRIHFTVIDCMGCGRLRCEDLHKACINAVNVEDVYASCREMLHWPGSR